MSFERHDYVTRVPFASSIYPQRKPSETLTILHRLNASRPSKKLPAEILLQIQQEVHHSNGVYENIHSTWTSLMNKEIDPTQWWDNDNLPLAVAEFNPDTKRYQIPEGPFTRRRREDPYTRKNNIYQHFHTYISSADLLYRLRCFFPELCIRSCGPGGYKTIWTAGVRHNRTGFILGFSESKGGSSLVIGLAPRVAAAAAGPPEQSAIHDVDYNTIQTSSARSEMLQVFSADSVHLIHLFSETEADGSPRLVYFHPAADADVSASDVEGYIAVPPMLQDRKRGSSKPYMRWRPVEVSIADLSPLSSFHSLLPDLKYDIKSRKVDPVNGETHLTSVISSSLLFYRLLCHYRLGYHGNAAINGDAPITSVWQVQLCYTEIDARIIFMDDHGLFDIQADEDAQEVMDDIIALVNVLCSDQCTHPYDGTVAGCIA